MGFAGQLSLGHSLYVGVGAYAAGAHLLPLRHRSVGRAVAGDRCCACCSALVIGFLAFRFGISGVYFALLTIAFAEFTRIGFDHLDWLGGPGGMFLKVAQRDTWDMLQLPRPAGDVLLRDARPRRGRICAVRVAAALTRRLLLAGDPRERGSGAGARHQHVPLEDARGGDQLGDDRGRRACSSPSTTTTSSPSRSSISAARSRSSSGPIIGGIGTLFGPILGAAVLTLLSDGITELLAALGWEIPGIKQVFYGVVLLVVVMFLPHGIWPPLARRLGSENEPARGPGRLQVVPRPARGARSLVRACPRATSTA